ncbi:hypothetical protein A2U01_0059976, partial [Trifolium medium]|nr:hypothetical protein [Trifolium medium]
SSGGPKDAWVVDGVVKGGSVEEEEVGEEADLQLCYAHAQDGRVQVDGDVSLSLRGKGQTPTFVSGGNLYDKDGNLLQKVNGRESFEEGEVEAGGASVGEVTKGDREEEIVESSTSKM